MKHLKQTREMLQIPLAPCQDSLLYRLHEWYKNCCDYFEDVSLFFYGNLSLEEMLHQKIIYTTLRHQNMHDTVICN